MLVELDVLERTKLSKMMSLNIYGHHIQLINLRNTKLSPDFR